MKNKLKILGLTIGLILSTNSIQAKEDYIKRDSLNRVIEKIEYFDNGKIKEKEKIAYYKNTDEEIYDKEWKYNTYGKRISYKYEKYKVYWVATEGEYESDTTYKQDIYYTTKGIKKTQKVTTYKNEKYTSKKVYTYNKKGVLKSNKYGKAKRIKYYYNNGKYSYKLTAYYNSKGKLGKSKKVVNKTKILSTTKIKEIALAKTAGGTITSFETDYENKVKYYEVEIIKGSYEHSLVISETGKIVEYKVELED